jgi:uncharacterized membrane protein
MDGFIGLLILLVIGLAAAGPVAFVLAIVLFSRISNLERRISRMEFKDYEVPVQPSPKPTAPPVRPIPPQAPPEPPASEPVRPPVEAKPPAVEIGAAPSTVSQPPAAPPTPFKKPAEMDFSKAFKTPKTKESNMEVKIGVTVALVIGVITVIIGVGFFLKYIYENVTIPPAVWVGVVAAGGFVALVIGEVTRRRDYGIVAKGVTALGFALLYAAVFSAFRVFELINSPWAFAGAIAVTAGAMIYAVCLDAMLIAFLSLLGGYLSPIIISTGRNLPFHLFGYVLVLSLGAMAAAAFRRWRSINWMAFLGTYILYTLWYEKFYAPDQMMVALVWLGIFGGLYLLLPMMHGLVRKIAARGEDVALIAVNNIVVFSYLWRMLYADYQKELALAAAGIGAVHMAMIIVTRLRCRDDVGLQSVLGVAGTAFITAAIGLYFARLQPALIGWAIEAVVLAFITIRYRSLWAQVMAIIVAGIATAGLFYHLPLHETKEFTVFLNEPFGTWLFVALSLMVCHGLWRFIRNKEDEEAALTAQVYYVWGLLLLAVGAALEWYNHCEWHFVYVLQDQAYFLMGMMVIASILMMGFFLRPVCPKGDLVRSIGVMTSLAGTVFVAMALMGVYYEQFRLLLNLPFGLAVVFAAVLFFAAWQVRQAVEKNHPHAQIPAALVVMGLILLFVMLSEQMYSYWYWRNEKALEPVADWQTTAHQFMFITWAVYGLVLLFAGIRFDKLIIRVMAFIVTGLSAAGLFYHVPLHHSGDFRFVFNLPFITWVCVSLGLLCGHVLWRMTGRTDECENKPGSQIYYTAGGLLLALGAFLEWYAHCRWQISSADTRWPHFWLGGIFIWIVFVAAFLARPLPPAGWLVKVTGLLAAFIGAIYTAIVMNDVYTGAFTIFANVPFGVAMLYVLILLLAGWFLKRADAASGGAAVLSSGMVLAGLVLVWILLSEQVYQFWYCAHKYGDAGANWEFLAQMYMSVAWAIYAAVLLVIGFGFRARGIRYLSLAIFAVLLGKIFIIDTATLRTEYRIAAFLTTGLVLVGVSFLYQFLKKKGFFDMIENQIVENEEHKERSIP